MIKVDKGVKAPKKGGKREKYPWSELKKGDSFFIPNSVNSPYSMLRAYNNRSGKRPIEITTKQENGGIRVWRIK